MAGSKGLRSVLGMVVMLGFVVTSFAQPRTTAAAGPPLPAWTGGVNLYVEGTFTTQKTWLWCTAAGVQVVRNIVEGAEDHSTRSQRRYFEWMRARIRYDVPESAGVDPAGWTAGLRHFVDDRYRLVASRTFDEALQSAVENLRLTNLPVALAVAHGGHGWILTGFSATADPATTTTFRVTSVRVVGPLYGRQSKNGYDMAPNTRLTPAQLRRYFTPWEYDSLPMVWDGRYVSIQPVSSKSGARTPSVPSATVPATAAPRAALDASALSGPLARAMDRPDTAWTPDETADSADRRSTGGVPLVPLASSSLLAVALLGRLAVP